MAGFLFKMAFLEILASVNYSLVFTQTVTYSTLFFFNLPNHSALWVVHTKFHCSLLK